MSGLAATFAGIVTGLSQSFRLSAFFPAAVFVIASLTLLGQYIGQSEIYKALTGSTFGELILVFSLCLGLGYGLSILNVTLTQLYEGYFFRHNLFGRILTAVNIYRRNWLKERLQQLHAGSFRVTLVDLPLDTSKNYIERRINNWARYDTYLKHHAERQAMKAELLNYFPQEPDAILPTKLGNVFAAFEDYPRKRYSMETVTLWPRMIPNLLKSGYANVVEQEKMGFDFFLNLSFLSALFAIEYSALSLYFTAKLVLVIPLLSLFMSWVFYRCAIRAALNYGVIVRVAFDLHKDALGESLGLETAPGLAEEKFTWRSYSNFVLEGNLPDRQSIFVYPRPRSQNAAQQPDKK
jgi:hypothetical protein